MVLCCANVRRQSYGIQAITSDKHVERLQRGNNHLRWELYHARRQSSSDSMPELATQDTVSEQDYDSDTVSEHAWVAYQCIILSSGVCNAW